MTSMLQAAFGFIVLILFGTLGVMAFQQQHAQTTINVTNANVSETVNATSTLLQGVFEVPSAIAPIMIVVAVIFGLVTFMRVVGVR